jgi:membrane fusion protein, multidrug efflux system
MATETVTTEPRTNRASWLATSGAKWGVIGLVVVLAAGVAWWWVRGGRETTDDAQIDGNVVPIAAKVGGIVKEVAVRENQQVAAGDLLATIDTRDYDVALARAEADRADAQAAVAGAQAGVPVTSATTQSQLTSAQAEGHNAEAGVQLAERQVEAARARVAAAQAGQREAETALRKAQQDVQRLKALVEKDEVSRQQYDSVVAAEQAAQAGLDSARAAVAEAESGIAVAESRLGQARSGVAHAASAIHAAGSAPQQVQVTRARLSSAEARLKQTEAAVQQAKLNLEYAVVKAPAAGAVGRKNVEPGQVVQPGQPLMALVSLTNVWVTANFKETQLEEMRPGQRAEVSVDAYGGRTYAGKVDSIAPATGARFSLLPPDNAAGNFVKVVQRVPIRIALDPGQDAEQVLRPGMSVTVSVITR